VKFNVRFFLLAAIASTLVSITANAESPERSSSPEDARLYFIAPRDGQVVNGEFRVQFGLRGMGVAPAGVDSAHSGHHHLLIDFDGMPELDLPMPKSEHLLHFGGGQTETLLNLPAGQHTLQLILGNHLHIPHQPIVQSEKISILVE
jgi:hypothetical protein